MLNKILSKKIIAIIRGVNEKDITNLADALIKGGIDSIEVALDHKSDEKIEYSLNLIKIISEKFGDKINVGAGTVLTSDEVIKAKKAGATFIISPNVNEDVIKKTKELGLISMPGAFTATEIVNAKTYGADVVKVFPAANVGPSYIKNVLSPLPHIKLMAVGGINLENAKSFIDAGAVGLGIGGNLVDKNLIKENKFDKITGIAIDYVKKINDAK